jgi:hypothetical protein
VASLALAFAATTSWACRAPPAQQIIGVDQQLAQASDVMLAQVIGITPLGDNDVEYRFLVLDSLHGTDRKSFELNGHAVASDLRDTTYDHHKDMAFWARGGGRTMNYMDCVIHPNFAVGGVYLVFLDAAHTRRSYEQIDAPNGIVDEDDRWLKYVKAKLGVDGSRAMAQQPVTPAPDYERIGRFIYSFQRTGASPDSLRSPGIGMLVPAEMVPRARALAIEYDHILTVVGKVPDEEMAAALREAAVVGAALQNGLDKLKQ